MNTFYRRAAWAMFYIFLACLLLANSFSYLDPDFGWHLKVGQHIITELRVPHDQVYMWTLEGRSWVDHEWLSNAITYKLWRATGYIGVTIFFILVPLIGLLTLNWYVFKNYIHKQANRIVLGVVEAFALIACLPHFGVRMQEFSFLATILLFIIIDSCRRQKKVRLAYWLIPLLYIWACLHAGFLFGAAIVVGWLAYELIIRWWPRFDGKEKKLNTTELVTLSIIVLVAIGSTLATPYGLELYSFLSDYGTNTYYIAHIEEWRSPYTAPLAYPQILFSVCMAAVAINYWLINKRWPSIWQLVILIGLFLLACKSVRHFPLWAAGSLLWLAPAAINFEMSSLKIPYGKIAGSIITLCLTVLSAQLCIGARYTKDPFSGYCDTYPCAAITYLKQHPNLASKKMFNDYGWGGFFIAEMPEKKLFIDGRLPQYTIKNWTMLEEYNEFFQKDKIKNKLDEYEIKMVLMKKNNNFYTPDFFEKIFLGHKPAERRSPLLDYVAGAPGWRVAYEDLIAIVYERD